MSFGVVHSARFNSSNTYFENLERLLSTNVPRLHIGNARRILGKMDEHSDNSFIKIHLSEVIIAIGPRLGIPRIIWLSILRIDLS